MMRELTRGFWIAAVLSFSMCASNVTTGCAIHIADKDLVDRMGRAEAEIMALRQNEGQLLGAVNQMGQRLMGIEQKQGTPEQTPTPSPTP